MILLLSFTENVCHIFSCKVHWWLSQFIILKWFNSSRKSVLFWINEIIYIYIEINLSFYLSHLSEHDLRSMSYIFTFSQSYSTTLYTTLLLNSLVHGGLSYSVIIMRPTSSFSVCAFFMPFFFFFLWVLHITAKS